MDNSNIPLAPSSAIAHVQAPANTGPGSARVAFREVSRASIQLSGFGSGAHLMNWLNSNLKAAPGPNMVAGVLDGAATLAAIAPATWLLMGAPDALNSIVSSARGDIEKVAAITDLSDGRNSFFELEGAAAATVLSKCIDIDFEGGGLSSGHCASTGIHGTAVLVICHRTDLYEISVHRSLASSLAETLVDGAAEFDVSVVRMGE